MMDRLRGIVRFEPRPHVAGHTSREFLAVLPDGTTTVCGFILPTSRPFCEGCRRLRITADGNLMGCLARTDAVSLEAAVAAMEGGDPAPLRACVAQALFVKSRTRRFREQRLMQAVGG
jgi:GTP 3',8-cyclase